MNDNSVKKILILTANPKNSTPLRLNQEVREIDEGLTRAKQRERFDLEQKWAVRPRDVQRAILDLAPQIVHFSGHGVGEDGLAFEDETGQAKLVSTQAIAGLFELFADQVECVLLNACYSEVQAEAIAQHIPYVIGMNQAIGDTAAREFAVGFYDALGAGRDLEFAYKFACNSICMAGIPEDLTPVLKMRANVNRKTISPAWEEVDGPVPLGSTFYVDRSSVEEKWKNTIAQPGALIRIQAPRQTGKSSLTLRILDYAENQLNYHVARLSLRATEMTTLSSLTAFLQWLCSRTTNKLKLSDKVGESWQGVTGSLDKCTNYFEKHLLNKINAPIVLCLDDVDQLFKYPAIASDFFGLLRSWYEESKFPDSIWRQLRLVLTYSQDVNITLDINRSPFNVGVEIELPPFNQMQIEGLLQCHRLNWTEVDIQQFMAMVGGHPYLTRVALQQLACEKVTLVQFLQVAPTQAWRFANHLNRHFEHLGEENLVTAMKQVVASNKPVRLPIADTTKLVRMGLVQFDKNDVKPFCDLYEQYFRELLK